MDYVRYWSDRAEVTAKQILSWANVYQGTYHDWCKRYGKVNEHNGWIPRDHWLEAWEKEAIIAFYTEQCQSEGYRRVTYMMLDQDIVAASPSSVYRVLSAAGLLGVRPPRSTMKGKGFQQPSHPHRDWHIDISFLNICGTFYHFIGILDGFSRKILHWDIRERGTEWDVEMVVQRCRETYPNANPRIISDNGPQFVAKEFKQFVRLCGMTHVRTSPYYPQSNGKLERFHRSYKEECIRPGTPLTLDDARRITADYVTQYNDQRLHGAIGYITPTDKFVGRAEQIHAERDRKLEAARARRAERRRSCHATDVGGCTTPDHVGVGA